MKKSKRIVLLTTASLLAAGGLFVFATKSRILMGQATNETHHSGNHYIGVSASTSNAGVFDYYVCCSCHEILLEPGEGNTWVENGQVSEETINYVKGNTNDIRYAPSYSVPLTSNGAFIYGKDGATIITKSTNNEKAMFTIEQVDTWLNSGIASIKFKLNFEAGTKDSKPYKVVVSSKLNERIEDTTGEKDYEIALTKGKPVSIWSELGDNGVDIPITLSEFEFGKQVESITLSDYADTVKFGKTYKFDGKVTANFDDGTTLEVSDYAVDYSTVDSLHTGPSYATITYGGQSAKANVNVIASDELKVLLIGNSFSIDTQQWVYNIAKSMGVTDINVVNMAIGGCSLSTHYNNIVNDSSAYEHYVYNNGWQCTSSTAKLSDAIKEYDWDFISFQQVSQDSGMPNTYNPYIENIATWLVNNATNPDVRLVWNMTWAYQSDSTHSGFVNYGNNQLAMYNAICSTVQEKAEPLVDLVVPNGTAIQNARTSFIGDNFTRDGFHLNLDYGRYIAGLTFVSKLTGRDPTTCDYFTPGMSPSHQKVAIESARNALANPYKVTASNYLVEPQPEDGLFEYGPISYTDGYYWNPQEGLELTGWNKFLGSQAFTPETLPVGSLLKIASGYKVRCDRFSFFDYNPKKTRLGEYQNYLYITKDLWEDYKFLTFNLSKVDGSTFSNASMYEAAHKAITFYTPTQMAYTKITYLALTELATWSTLNPEIAVEAYGFKGSKAVSTVANNSIFTYQEINSFPSWAEVNNGTSGTNAYGWVSPITHKNGGTEDASKTFLFRINNKVDGTTINIKKGVTFTQNGNTYAFDKDYKLVFDGEKWHFDDVATVSLVDIYTWASGNPSLVVKYSDNIQLRPIKVLQQNTAPESMTVEGTTFSNLSYAFATGANNAYLSELWLIRVADPNKQGIKINLLGGVIFEHAGQRFKFDKDYTIVRGASQWVNENATVYSLSVDGVFTWTTGNPEIKITYPNDAPRISTDGQSTSSKPQYLELVGSLAFTNITWNFPSPSMHQRVDECVLFRFSEATRVDGAQFKLLTGITFVFNGNTYQFDKTYVFTLSSGSWVMSNL